MVTDIYLTCRVVNNPNVYPGSHQIANERTSGSLKPLEPKSQVRKFFLILRFLLYGEHSATI